MNSFFNLVSFCNNLLPGKLEESRRDISGVQRERQNDNYVLSVMVADAKIVIQQIKGQFVFEPLIFSG